MRRPLVSLCFLLGFAACADRGFKTDHPQDPLTPLGGLMWSTVFCGYQVQPGRPTIDGSPSDFPAMSVVGTDPQGDGSGTEDILSISALQDGSMLYIFVAMTGTPTTGTLALGRSAQSIRFTVTGAVSDACPVSGPDIGAAYSSAGAEFYLDPRKCLPGVPGHSGLGVSVPQSPIADSARTCDLFWFN